MSKKNVSLEIFEESVLPMLQQKHTEIADLQRAIKDDYSIYEDDGKGVQTPVNYKVQGTAPQGKSAEEIESDLDARIAAAVAKGLEPLTKAKNPKKVNNPGKLGDDQNQAPGDDGETKAFKIPAECKVYSELKAFTAKSVPGSTFAADERAFRFGMWALSCLGKEWATKWCDEQGIGRQERKFSDDLMQKLHSEGTNSAGGYLVPPEFGQDLIILREKYGVARRIANVVPMQSDTRTDPRLQSSLTSYFVAEGAAGTESTTSWDQVRLTVKDLMVLTRVTAQVNADSIINWSDRLATECAYQFALKEDQCMFVGDATSTYGGITGVTTQLTNKWTAATAGTINGITKASSTTLASLALADFESALGSLPVYAQARNPVWVTHSFTYYSTMLRLALAAGGVTSMEVNTGNRAPRPVFLGYPVEFSQVMPSATAATTIFALLGDFSLGVSFGDRQQSMISFSEHASVGSQSVFERNEIAVRAVERFDINVHDVGDGTTPGPIVAVATG